MGKASNTNNPTPIANKTSKRGDGHNHRDSSGRKRRQCAAWRVKGAHEKHKVRDLIAHVQKNPEDHASISFLRRYLNRPMMTMALGKDLMSRALGVVG